MKKTSAPVLFFLLSFVGSSLAATGTCPALGCAAADERAFAETGAEGGPGDGSPSAFVVVGDEPPAPSTAAVMSPAPTEGEGEDGGAAPGDASIAANETEDAAVVIPPPSPPFDAGEAGACTKAIGMGDLIIDELMIESTAGTGDHGEWVEVESTLDCALDLIGLSGTAPAGAKVVTFEIDSDVWIPARGTFVIADSTNPALNHELPGLVVPWSGQPGDVLRNKGVTVTLLMNGDIVDSVTSPALKLTPGVSIAFPHDCSLSLRPAWADWQLSIASWFPEFRGTPNAPNDDVHCPVVADE